MLPQLRENAWLNYPPPAVSSQFIDPPRYEPPPPGEHYPREHRSSQNCKGRKKNWQNRKRGNDNWKRRDKFKSCNKHVSARQNWDSYVYCNEGHQTYQESVPRPNSLHYPQPPPFPQNHMHNLYPSRTMSYQHRNQESPDSHHHSYGVPLYENKENLSMPMDSQMDMYSFNSLRTNFNKSNSALPLHEPLPSYPSNIPLVEQKCIDPNQNLSYNTCISKAQVQLPDIPKQSTTEVSSFASYSLSVQKLDVNALFKKLVATGVIADAKKISASEENKTQNKHEDKRKTTEVINEEKIPLLNFSNMNTFKRRYNSIINAIYRGTLCSSCGLRFADQDKYNQHLDWHFKVNRRKKNCAKKAFIRNLYFDVKDWIQLGETEDVEQIRSLFEVEAEEWIKASQKVEVPNITASTNESENVCVVCGEHLNHFWCDEKEEWLLKNAIRIDNQTFHPDCYEDFPKDNEIQETCADEMDVDLLSTLSTVKTDEETKD